MYRVTIVDNAGIPRAWAEGQDIDELLRQTIAVTSEYTQKRPDCAPLRLGDFSGDPTAKMEPQT